MDREVIEQKIESLRRCVERVRQKCPATPDALASDPDAQDILTLNLTRAIQLCVDIGAHLIAAKDTPAPTTMGQTFDLLAGARVITADLALRMKKAVGFRNVAIHNYEAIDWQIAHDIATRHMQDFAEFSRAISASTDSRASP